MNNSVSESRHDRWEGCLCRGVNGLVGGWGRMGRIGILSYLIARIRVKQMSSRFLMQKRIVARTLKAFQNQTEHARVLRWLNGLFQWR